MPALRRPHSPGQAWRPELAVSSPASPRQRPNDYECACLTLERGKTYNTHNAEVAQVVEQRTENPRVSSSTLLLGTSYAVVGAAGWQRSALFRQLVKPSGVEAPKWRKGRRDSLKNCWGATPVSVRIRPSAPRLEVLLPGGVAVAQRTLDPLAQVRILARQPSTREPRTRVS